MKLSKINIIIFLLTFSFQLSPFSGLAQHWVPDTNNKFHLRMIVDGGQGTKLYVYKDTLFLSGSFSWISDIHAFNIARYSNGRWDSLRGGIYGSAYAMQYVNGYLYVMGNFENAFNVGGTPYPFDGVPVYRTSGTAKWDGNQWYSIDTSVDCFPGNIYDMLYFNNKFYFAGQNLFGLAWGMISFDGTTWGDRCSTGLSTLNSYHNDLLAGDGSYGFFFRYIGNAQFDSIPYGGVYGGAYRMTTDTINNFLYVSGSFNWVDRNHPIESHGIAMYDGFKWHSMGTNNPYAGLDLKMYHGYLYAGTCSQYMEDSSIAVNYIARWDWDTFKWHPLGSGVEGGYSGSYVSDLEVFNDTLFVTGGFTIAGGDSAIGLARWYMPDTNCAFLHPLVNTAGVLDTFYLSQGHVDVPFYNNNSYADTWNWDFSDGGTSNTKDPIHIYTDTGTFNVSVTVSESGCTKTATKTITILHSSGIDPYTEESLNFKIYPNPTTGDFTVECTLPANKTGLIKTYNSYGSYLREFPLESGCNHIVIPAGKWFTNVILCGLYIDGKQILVEKVVKQ